MSQKRMIDLLRRAQEFHTKLSVFYGAGRDMTDDEEVKLLLDFMSRHEQALSKTIKEYESSAPPEVLERWFRFPQDSEIEKAFEQLNLEAGTTKEEAIAMAMAVEAVLLSIYEQLLASAVSEELSSTVKDLLEMEQRQEIQKMRASLSYYD